MHSLACAINAPLRGGPKGVRLVSTEAEDYREHSEGARVVLNPTEERR